MCAELDDGQVGAMLVDWLQRAGAGDQAALDRLLKTLGPIIRRRARRYLRSRADLRPSLGSDDVQQLALIDLADQVRNGQVRAGSCGELLQLVSKIVDQKISRAARSEQADRRDGRRTVSLLGASEIVSAGDHDAERLAMGKEIFAVAQRHLTPEEKKIAQLYLEGVPWREIAALVGGTENAVRHQWRRALAHIRQHLTPPPTKPPEGVSRSSENVVTTLPTAPPHVRR